MSSLSDAEYPYTSIHTSDPVAWAYDSKPSIVFAVRVLRFELSAVVRDFPRAASGFEIDALGQTSVTRLVFSLRRAIMVLVSTSWTGRCSFGLISCTHRTNSRRNAPSSSSGMLTLARQWRFSGSKARSTSGSNWTLAGRTSLLSTASFCKLYSKIGSVPFEPTGTRFTRSSAFTPTPSTLRSHSRTICETTTTIRVYTGTVKRPGLARVCCWVPRPVVMMRTWFVLPTRWWTH